MCSAFAHGRAGAGGSDELVKGDNHEEEDDDDGVGEGATGAPADEEEAIVEGGGGEGMRSEGYPTDDQVAQGKGTR